MIPDHPKRELLLAYVDRALDPSCQREAELLIENDPEAAKFVALLKESELPYQEVFEPLLGSPVPEKVIETVNSFNPSESESLSFIRSTQWKGIAAGLGIGVLSTMLLMHVFTTPQSLSIVDSVSQYQSLYQRETVSSASRPDAMAIEKMMLVNFGKKLKIPDFSEHKLSFKRGQLLQFNGKPLVQLVYLADHGVPVAFCITASDQGQMTAPEFGKSHGLDYGYWHDSGLDFVIVGDHHNAIASLVDSAISQIQI